MGTTSRGHIRPPPMSKATAAADFEQQEEQTRQQHDVTPKARALAAADVASGGGGSTAFAAAAAVVATADPPDNVVAATVAAAAAATIVATADPPGVVAAAAAVVVVVVVVVSGWRMRVGERIAALSSLSLCVRSLLAMLIPRPSVHCLLPCPCAFSSWSVRWLLYISPSSSVSRIQPCAVHATQSTTGRGMLSMCGCADEARPLSITHRSVRCCAARDRSNRGDQLVVGGGGSGGTASSLSIQPSPSTAASDT